MITPKQAYEAAKVLWPGMEKLEEAAGSFTVTGDIQRVSIDWGDTDQYPLPEPEWVDAVFPDDVGKEGRFSKDSKTWHKSTICGRRQNGLWIGYASQWRFCQVRKVKT